MIYKIRNKMTNQWSNGAVVKHWDGGWKVRFNKHGKEWHAEATLKKHILTVMTKMQWNPDWEIVEVMYKETKPAIDWVDQNMLLTLMKTK